MKKPSTARSSFRMIMYAAAGCLAGYAVIGAVMFIRAGSCRMYDPGTDPGVYDLVVAFAGGEDRIPPAFDLIRKGKAKTVVISPATREEVDKRWARNNGTGECPCILELKATSTHENAYYTAGIIRRVHARKVILITSFYHMKRSHRLLALALRGTQTEIACYPSYPEGVTDVETLGTIPGFRRYARIERYNTVLNFLKFLSDGLRIRKSGQLEHRLEWHYDYKLKDRITE